MGDLGEAREGEMEKFLLGKLQAGIDRKVPHSGKCKKMKKMLEIELESAGDEKSKGKIREKLYSLNNLMKEYNSRLDCFRWSFLRSFKQLKKDIEEAAPEKKPDGAATSTWSSSCAERRIKGLGLEPDELALKNLLVYQRGIRCEVFNAVGIIGAEGVGKTTLAHSIFSMDEVVDRFLPRIWISLSEEGPGESFQIAIAKRILLALGISEETIDNICESGNLGDLVHAIRLELMGKRYLIVLDDASFENSSIKEWYSNVNLEATPESKLKDKLGFAFPKGSGGTLLVIGNAVNDMLQGGTDIHIHRLLPLEDPELCWKICQQQAAAEEQQGERVITIRSDDDKHKMKAEVVKRSNGLPAAARLMGKMV